MKKNVKGIASSCKETCKFLQVNHSNATRVISKIFFSTVFQTRDEDLAQQKCKISDN